MSETDQRTKLFNTAVIATKIPKVANYTARLTALIQSPPFHAILKAIQEHAKATGVSEEQAAEELIHTFREIDQVWDSYIFQEGLDKLRAHLKNNLGN